MVKPESTAALMIVSVFRMGSIVAFEHERNPIVSMKKSAIKEIKIGMLNFFNIGLKFMNKNFTMLMDNVLCETLCFCVFVAILIFTTKPQSFTKRFTI